jgi:hypothetical protein
MTKIEIPLSKKRILLALFGALVFVVIGILFITIPDTFISPIFSTPQIIRIAGIPAVLFFGAVGIYIVKKLFDKRVGLTIDEKGILDNTNASSVGLIGWNDIVEIKTKQVMTTKFLLIFTKSPDEYIMRFNGFKRKLLQRNMKVYGTPLSITSSTLSYRFDDLERVIKNTLIVQREKMANP